MGGGSPTSVSQPPPDSVSDRDFHHSSGESSSPSGFDSLRDDFFDKIADEFVDGTCSGRKWRTYKAIMQSYQDKSILERNEILENAKCKILSYKAGSWIEEVGGFEINDYDIPRTTTLLMVGPKGSGKSTLVNRISRVFESDKFCSDRAQVFYNQSGDGTYFLQEYIIPKESASFCLYDTRSLSENPSENFKLLKNWMTQGVQHGQMVIRDSDSAVARKNMKIKARHILQSDSEKRMVNFVIFVVDGLSVHKSMANEDNAKYTRMLAESFNCPYLSFKDDKPVLVITHVDELSLSDRARIRIHLGDLLGIPPTTQIFDIPDKCDPSSELTIVEMIYYCLEHADRNLPIKQRILLMGFEVQSPWMAELMVIMLFVMLFMVIFYMYRPIVCGITGCSARRVSSDFHIDWHSIRHMWMG